MNEYCLQEAVAEYESSSKLSSNAISRILLLYMKL